MVRSKYEVHDGSTDEDETDVFIDFRTEFDKFLAEQV